MAWMSIGSVGNDADSFSIQARRFFCPGTPIGGQFQVNTHTKGRQFVPAIAPTRCSPETRARLGLRLYVHQSPGLEVSGPS